MALTSGAPEGRNNDYENPKEKENKNPESPKNTQEETNAKNTFQERKRINTQETREATIELSGDVEKAIKEIRDKNIKIAERLVENLSPIAKRLGKESDIVAVSKKIDELRNEKDVTKIKTMLEEMRKLAFKVKKEAIKIPVETESAMDLTSMIGVSIEQEKKKEILNDLNSIIALSPQEAEALDIDLAKHRRESMKRDRDIIRNRIKGEVEEELAEKYDVGILKTILNLFGGEKESIGGFILKIFSFFDDDAKNYFEEMNSGQIKNRIEEEVNREMFRRYGDDYEKERIKEEAQIQKGGLIQEKMGYNTKYYNINKEGGKENTKGENSIETKPDGDIERILINGTEYSLTNQSSYRLKINHTTGKYDIVNADLEDETLISFDELFKIMSDSNQKEVTLKKDEKRRILGFYPGYDWLGKEDIILTKGEFNKEEEIRERDSELKKQKTRAEKAIEKMKDINIK